MLKFILRLITFILPLALAYIFIPVDTRNRFINMEGDCAGHSLWMYDRIHINTLPADIIFLGTSHSFNGINDEIVGNVVGNKHVLNLGYCRIGYNLYYAQLKELLEYKKPQKVVMEGSEFPCKNFHPMFGYWSNEIDQDIFTTTNLRCNDAS